MVIHPTCLSTGKSGREAWRKTIRNILCGNNIIYFLISLNWRNYYSLDESDNIEVNSLMHLKINMIFDNKLVFQLLKDKKFNEVGAINQVEKFLKQINKQATRHFFG